MVYILLSKCQFLDTYSFNLSDANRTVFLPVGPLKYQGNSISNRPIAIFRYLQQTVNNSTVQKYITHASYYV